MTKMFSVALKKFKVLYSVVIMNPVQVMNYLSALKRTAKVHRHHKAVFRDITISSAEPLLPKPYHANHRMIWTDPNLSVAVLVITDPTTPVRMPRT
jgi:hypothetical protein